MAQNIDEEAGGEKAIGDHREHSPASSTNGKNELAREQTLGDVDIENKDAYKGDDSDGIVGWNAKKAASAFFLAALYTGSQVILYFVGGSLQFIEPALHVTTEAGWLPVSYTLAIAAIAPYCGYLQDLFGKRYIALFGAMLCCVGIIILGTAHHFGQGVAGLAIAGSGAAIGELTALAGLSETVPVKHRGYALAALSMLIFTFIPYIMYSQLLGTHATWRWTAWISLIYNAICFFGLAIFYHPHMHTRAQGFSRMAILKKIDYVGGFLSIVGFTLLLVALQAGGYDHPWRSAYVLATLIVGILLLMTWYIYEWKFARHPMVPGALFRGQRVVALSFTMAFIGGMNFYSVLNFLPLTYSAVYTPDPVQIGLKGVFPAMATVIGAVVFNAALSKWPGNGREVLFAAATITTAFCGALACMNPHNPVTTVVIASFALLGVGGLIVPTAALALIAAPDAVITTAAALSLSVRTVGGSIGYTIYYNIFVKKLAARLPTYIATYAVEAGLPVADAKLFVETLLTAPANITSVPGVTPKVLAAATLGTQWAYANSLHYVWYTSIAFGLCSMIAAAFIPSTKVFQTNRVAVAL